MSNKPPSHRFPLSLRTPHTLSKVATLQRPSTSRVHAQISRTTTVIDIRVVSCNPMHHNLQTKEQKTLTTQTTRSPSSPDMATCIGRCFSKSGINEQGSNLPFRLIFGWCFFCDSVFRRIVPSRWSGRREVLSFPPLFCGVVFLGLLLRVVLFPLRAFGLVLLFGNQPHPKKREEGSTTNRRRRPSSPTRKGEEEKQHH